jgi:hypothetical protein
MLAVNLHFPLSLCPSISLSLYPSVFHSSNRRRKRDFASGVIVNVISDHPGGVRHAFIAGEVIHVHHIRPAVAFDDIEAVQTKAADLADAP